MYWLAENQLGLASKGAFFAIIPLLILIVTEVFVNRKEKRQMKKNATCILSIFVAVVNILSGNIAGSALLANALYELLRFVWMIDGEL